MEDGFTLPYVYSLLPNKNEATYIRFLEALKSKTEERGLNSIITDFQLSFLNAIAKVFPGVQVQGCYFHFSQCIWRKIQKYPEIVKRYIENDDYALNLRLLGALAFLPVHDIVMAFDILLESDFFVENEQLLSPIINYFEDVWVGRSQRAMRPCLLTYFGMCT